VEIHVLQGERELSKANKSLARFELVGIPPAPAGMPKIEVAFDIDSNGIVSVSAKDLETGLEQQVVVTPSSGLSPEEIDQAIAEAESHAEEDRRKIALSRSKAKLEGLLQSNEKTAQEFKDSLDSEKREWVRNTLEECKGALTAEDEAPVQEALDRLGEVSRVLAEVAFFSPTS
jgi:molecular chaperone DnaK